MQLQKHTTPGLCSVLDELRGGVPARAHVRVVAVGDVAAEVTEPQFGRRGRVDERLRREGRLVRRDDVGDAHRREHGRRGLEGPGSEIQEVLTAVDRWYRDLRIGTGLTAAGSAQQGVFLLKRKKLVCPVVSTICTAPTDGT